jgi:hypothetical protein
VDEMTEPRHIDQQCDDDSGLMQSTMNENTSSSSDSDAINFYAQTRHADDNNTKHTNGNAPSSFVSIPIATKNKRKRLTTDEQRFVISLTDFSLCSSDATPHNNSATYFSFIDSTSSTLAQTSDYAYVMGSFQRSASPGFV